MGDAKKLDAMARGICGCGWVVGPRREASACALSAAFLTGEHQTSQEVRSQRFPVWTRVRQLTAEFALGEPVL
jgi:hypothetical protein